MLAGRYRLKKQRDIEKVYREGKYGRTDFLIVKALNNNLSIARATIVVSGKISKKATVRNLIRRRISGQLEEMWQTIKPSCDIVITIRDDMSKLSGADIKKQLLASLKTCGAIETTNT